MAKNIIHISDFEAALDSASVLAHVYEGAVVVIEDNGQAVAMVSPVELHPHRTLSESLTLARARASAAILDGEFRRPAGIINSHLE
jgi:antitoxin (DNA-binding transcriptional repressor) of toxin-antitoxin stability system